MYVSVKGGEAAIENSWRLLAAARRGDAAQDELSVAQIASQLRLAVQRVMTEGSLYDPELAALAIKQASGDLYEAVFLLRAYRTTLARFAGSVPLDTGAMAIQRRISAAFKDLPGGQVLGPTHDYTQRLLDFALAAGDTSLPPVPTAEPVAAAMPRVLSLLDREGLIETPLPPPRGSGRAAAATGASLQRHADESLAGLAQAVEPFDLTREPLSFPTPRDARLQALARADEGWLLALGYSTQRGYANSHPFAGEIRMGRVVVEVVPDELGFAIDIGDITVTECQMINQFKGSRDTPPQFTQGYGLAFGECERKAMAMALVDRSLRARELGEPIVAVAQDEEFVLSHADSLESSGFVQHLKLPHYVDFQSELELVRRLRLQAVVAGEMAPDATHSGTHADTRAGTHTERPATDRRAAA